MTTDINATVDGLLAFINNVLINEDQYAIELMQRESDTDVEKMYRVINDQHRRAFLYNIIRMQDEDAIIDLSLVDSVYNSNTWGDKISNAHTVTIPITPDGNNSHLLINIEVPDYINTFAVTMTSDLEVF